MSGSNVILTIHGPWRDRRAGPTAAKCPIGTEAGTEVAGQGVRALFKSRNSLRAGVPARRAAAWAGFGAAVAAAIGIAGTHPAAAQQSVDLQDLFRQVLVNPTDTGANMRYAKEAERRGELRKALSAYERIVLNEPNNREARGEYERIKALLEPAQTRFQFGFGGQFETNTDLEDGNGRGDFAGIVTFRVDDDRRLFGSTLWRSSAQLYADAHVRSSSADFVYGSASTGPIFLVGNGWRFHPFVTAESGLADYDFLFWSGGIGGTLETRGSDPLRSVTASVSYADFASGDGDGPFTPDNGRDAVVAGLSVRLGWDNVIAKTDAIELRPQIVYNAADDSEYTFWQGGATLSYAASLFTFAGGVGNIFLSPEVTVQYRRYQGAEQGRSNDRKDFRVSPALRLIAMYDNYTAVLGYVYDRNFSNYDNENGLNGRNYENHRVGLNFFVDF